MVKEKTGADKEMSELELLKEKLKALEKENKKLKKKEVEKPKVEKTDKPKEKKKLPKDIEIIVKSNIDGEFGYTNNSTKTSVYVRFDGIEDEDIMTLEELRVFNNLTKYLKKGKISLCEMVDSDYELEDAIKYLKLNKLYNDEKSIAPNKIKDIFTDEYTAKEFDQILLNSGDIIESIIEVALIMKKTGELNDNAKISLMKQRSRNPSLFK